MNKSFYLLITLILVSFFSLTSCEESEGVDEYANWRQRNDAYIDSIAKVARENSTGKWRAYKSWNLPPDKLGSISSDVTDYVYIEMKEIGEGNITPLFTDSVNVNYRGRLINGKMFEETFTTEDPNPDFSIPVGFRLSASGLSLGFSTALQYMHVGDRGLVYIPWKLAYGSTEYGTIPAYSDLIFDLNLVKIIPLGEK